MAGGFFINEPPEKPESSIFVENLIYNRGGVSFKKGYLMNGVGTIIKLPLFPWCVRINSK